MFTWTVVEFLETEEVEAVPTKWLLRSQCYWPSLVDNQKLIQEIKKCEEPNTCWPLYHVRIFKNGTFNDYMMARNKAKRAEETSDLASEVGNRRRRRNPIYSSSDDEEASILPPVPVLKKPNTTKKGDVRFENEYDENSSNNLTPSRNKVDITPKSGIALSSRNQSLQSNAVIATSSSGAGTENCSNCCQMNYAKIEQALLKVVDGQKALRSQIFQMREEINQRPTTSINSGTSSFFTDFDCPVDNIEKLERIEEYIEVQENMIGVIYVLSRLGGRNIYESLKRSLSNLMTNSVAEQYSYHGIKGKRAFKNLKLNNALIESVSARKDFNKKEAEESIMKWLKRAKERKGN